MQYNSVAQAVRCEGLQKLLDEAAKMLKARQNHLDQLLRQRNMEQRQLENLNQQVQRTGDKEGFARQIWRVEESISSLNGLISDAREKQNAHEEQVGDVIHQMARAGCNNVA